MKMKCVRAAMCVIMLLTMLKGYSQNLSTKLKSIVEPLTLSIGVLKTTNLIFPYSIASIDRGSKDLLVQKAKGVENILQIKASSDSLKETNLTVVTADGSLYSFIIQYSPEPSILNLTLGLTDQQAKPAGLLPSNNDNEAKIHSNTSLVSLKRPWIFNLKDNSYDVGLRLIGIYIQEDVIYYQLELENKTNLRYNIDQIKFSILDKKKSKRTSSQEIDIDPIYVSGNLGKIETQSKQIVVFAMPKFTIPDGKELLIQTFERNGGRNLAFKVKNKHILNAKPF